MITVVFSGNENVKNYITGLWQWDYGQTLRIQGLDLPTAVEIHFSLTETEGEAVTRIGTTKDGVTDVVIPDSMLENEGIGQDYKIYAFVYLTDQTSGETVKRITLNVKSRPRPEAFDTPEDAELFREAIKEVNNAADRAETAETEAEKHASAASENAAKIAEDREKVEEMIATVSDIEQQVETVRNAAESAENSARAAEESKEGVAESANDARKSAQEAAKSEGNARQHAEKTEADKNKTSEDRAEVERLVATVSGVSEQVEAIKEYKDQAQSAATNALLSENESEKAKEDALLAQAGAESAADEAERHALDVAGDKTEVERLAAQVREDKEAVEQSKTSVEETAQGFDQTVQQAKESINTDAAEKVSAVQNAGAQAVERVNTAKGEAVKTVSDKGVEQVQAVEEKGQEVLNSFPDIPDMDAKLDKQQGAENAGKFLIVGEDGNVALGEVQPGSNIEVDATLTKDGEAADARATGDKILQYAIKNTVSGEGLIRIEDSANEKLLDLKMQGKTEQATFAGVNKFNQEEATKATNWTTKNVSNRYMELPFELGKSYTVNMKENNRNAIKNIIPELETDTITLCVGSAPGQTQYNKSINYLTPVTFTAKKPGTYLTIAGFGRKSTTDALLEKIFSEIYVNLQIQEGTTALPYEPYIGEKPIPNPENPREIINAGKKDEDIGKYTVNVKLTGKNLFNMEKASDFKNWIAETYAYFELPTKNGKEYTLSFKADSKGEVIWIGIFKATGGAKDAIELMIWGTTANAVEKKITFTAREHIYIGIFPVGNQSELQQRFTEVINDMQLEEGNVKTDYEPYREQLVTLSSDKNLTKFDRLEKRDGIWGWIYKTGMLNLADLDVFTIKDDVGGDNLTHRVYRHLPNTVRNSEAFCNKLYPFAAGDISNIKITDYECFNISNGDYLQMKLLKTRGNTMEQLKSFFAESDIQVMFESVEEEFVHLSQEEQELLNNLHTYYPATVISNGEGCEMEVTYAADTTTYVNNKIAEIAAAALKGV